MSTGLPNPAPTVRLRPEPPGAGAFTIIELLVAMTVTMLLVVALMQVFNATASTWQHGEAQVDAYREARGALQFMARDLSATLQAAYTQTSNTNAATFKPALPTLVLQRSPNSAVDSTGPNNEEVYCLTNIPNSGASSLCAVGYYCQWMPDYLPLSRDGVDRRPQAYALMRQYADSNATFLRIQTATRAGNVPLKFDDLFARPTSPVQLAAYIWDLRFRIDTDLNDDAQHVPDGNGPTSPVDHSAPPRYYRADGGDYPPRLPSYVEIRFKALSDTAGRRLEGPGTGVTKVTWRDTDAGFSPSAPYRTIIRPNAQQFVLRVPLIMPLPDPNAVNVSILPCAAGNRRRGRRGAFALVITLLILSLLVIVAVSYLSSMVSERQTADAYSAKARAEQVAQAGVDSAMAMMAESFRDFPDSATVWDPQQTVNNGTSKNPLIVSSDVNEGTSLYLRAVPTTVSVNGAQATVADPQPSGTAASADDPGGNNPNNPNCKTFVLPLISGVPGGRARLVTDKAAMLSAMNLAETDPTKQNFVDLNVRRYGPDPASANPTVKQYGDIWGVVGSPPDWNGTPSTSTTTVVGPTKGSGYGPRPARAYWVNLTSGDGRLTGRYAFWIEDESFRANVNYQGNAPARIDNVADPATHRYPLDSTGRQPYINRPSDASLGGILTGAFDASISADAQKILGTRAIYPGEFLTDPLAFAHSSDNPTGGTAFSAAVSDAFRYLTTTQSGSLNLTRHGTQRLSLNTTVTDPKRSSGAVAATKLIQHQIDQLVKTLQFHLPNFSQRFYRTGTGIDSATLNAKQVVYNNSLISQKIGDPNQIYFYKAAANLRDFIDPSNQPTLVQSSGDVYPVGTPPLQPYGGDTDPEANPMWAVGKTAAPFLQETAVRFRPVVPQSTATGGKGNYKLSVDYYLEFWNMSDRDITVADLNNPQIHVSDQQSWVSYPGKVQLTVMDSNKPPPQDGKNDFTIDLTGGQAVGGGVYLNGVLQDGNNGTNYGVVFRAGTATVITTDPDYQSYSFSTPVYDNTGKKNTTLYTSLTGIPNRDTTYYCPIVPPGTRTYEGVINKTPGNADYGIWPLFRDSSQDYGTEITFFNKYGYLDCALYSLAEGGSPISTYTETSKFPGGYNDYSYGGSLYGNSTNSQMGDPRTNNEQMIFHRNSGAGSGDFSRYYNGNHTLGYQNANYVQPVGGSGSLFTGAGALASSTFVAWPDYFTWPATNTPSVDLNAPVAPAVVAGRPLASIGQLGDVYDPARLSVTPETARGGGRTYKVGQRDDRVTYDPTGNPAPNNTYNDVPASLGWASWRLADVFSAGPVNPSAPYGPAQEPIEQPARINVNGVARDNGAALRTLLTGFNFQPVTVDARTSNVSEPLLHTPPNLAGAALQTQPTDNSGNASPFGVAKIVAQINTRLRTPPTAANVPWGPFFERGELGELAVNTVAIFGQNSNQFVVSRDLVNGTVDMNHTFDRGREEIFRRLAEMICTRGDTFTVYAVGQSLVQSDAKSAVKVTGTHRMRVTFRLVPRQLASTGSYVDFHPAYLTVSATENTIKSGVDFNPKVPSEVSARFAKPDRYDVQILEANTF